MNSPRRFPSGRPSSLHVFGHRNIESSPDCGTVAVSFLNCLVNEKAHPWMRIQSCFESLHARSSILCLDYAVEPLRDRAEGFQEVPHRIKEFLFASSAVDLLRPRQSTSTLLHFVEHTLWVRSSVEIP